MNLTDYIPHGMVATVATLVGYIGRNHFNEDKKVAARVATLEADRIVKADIDRIHDRIDSLGTEIGTAQREILLAIAGKHV